MKCRNEYPTSDRTARIVRCHLQDGHPGEHEEEGTGITWQAVPADPTVGTIAHADRLTEGRHPSTRDALRWLTFSHLPVTLQVFSRPFYRTAVDMIREVGDSPELAKALNALTEAKDWHVRAGIRHTTGRAGSVPRPQEIGDVPDFARGQAAVTQSAGWTRPVRDSPQA